MSEDGQHTHGQHPIEGLMKTAMENLQEMTDVNTIVGDPVETPDGKNVILTVSKVGFGFAAGGSQFNGFSGEERGGELPFGGGSGGGVSITPIAFLIVGEKDIQMIHLDNTTHLYEKLLNLAPQAVEKIQQIVGENTGSSSGKSGSKKKKSKSKDESSEEED